MQNHPRSLSVALALVALSSIAGAQTTIHVPGDAPNIQAAIQLTLPGDVVEVADGLWTGDGNRDLVLPAHDIVVRSANGPRHCVIDSQGTVSAPHRAFIIDLGQTRATRVSGFTITGGETLPGAIANEFNGGGILIDASSPTIENCRFIDNRCACWGGALCATFGGSPLVTACHFEGNFSGDEGGAVFCWSNAQLEVESSVFIRNSSGNVGSAIVAFDSFTGRNLTIVENTGWGATAVMIGDSSLTDSIVWGNLASGTFVGQQISSWQSTVDHCLVEGGHVTGTMILDTDPLFQRDGIHIRPDSPCINAGDPTVRRPRGMRDIDGDQRPLHARIDIGADESRVVVTSPR